MEIRESGSLKDQEARLNQVQQKINNYQNFNNEILNEINQGELFDQSFEESLLQMVGNFVKTHSLQLVDFSDKMVAIRGEIKVETIQIKVKGDFFDNLKLLHHLEQHFGVAQVASAEYLLENNLDSDQQELFQILYLQNLVHNEEVN
jgi:hypothetical protein